jgi:CRP-like cAMP-binding protein
MPEQTERERLANARPLVGLDAAAIEETALAGRRRQLCQGETIFRQGEPADELFVLLQGRVKVAQVTPDGQQVVVRFLGPGEMMGCVAAWGGGNYPGTATAQEDTSVIGWSGTVLGRLVERHPAIARNLLGSVGHSLQQTQTRLRELATERVERRIAHALLRLAGEAGGGGELRLTRQDLAELSGTTLFTVSRMLSAWEAQGIVESGRGHVAVRRADALAAIAEDTPAP